MRIKRLQLSNLRSIQSLAFDASADINIIHGQNGSGKTSILEGLHFLSVARSFRTHQSRYVISEGQQQLTCFAKIEGESDSGGLGVERTQQGDVRARFRGEEIDLTALAGLVPMQVIDSESFTLLDGSPSVRRQFIDWGGFHHSTGFISVWRGFQRALKQRNSLLKRGNIDRSLREVWDREFILHAERLTELRSAYVDALLPHFTGIAEQLVREVVTDLRFSPGWDKDQDLQTLLNESFERDMRQGFTSLGPQRADLKFKVGSRSAAEHLSRGQKKLVVSALKLAQGQLYEATRGHSCIYLIDDLPAELDKEHLATFCSFLKQSNSQSFVTCVEPSSMLEVWGATTDGALLNVDSGQLTAKQTFGEIYE
ncbi:DNA replication and repair protein RecF [Marinobacterium sp. xm-a-121]|jgi:DNA replication and repair protein RecF|uniref:DNA replication/repair protein RecF n=1 Tax=unclassified Marinobacterium TaxID=2644139 RepID=UPI001567CD57|nr:MULTISPECIES: DNA replication/repair protein RecF [unclassified Marinobacterium]NRP11124.1 DNA replication and repair protein RecF [Marinobacterium sp. xm-g-48]NRP36659.1 DNA replication and repair protein RecF [Marinobacterium sp. xm-d-579]NRP38709.1 DNA replication and repair protein RecF [Marinobacterium sp. xm-a-121]NRP83969.1 DNA replication and repair protein RecF [Marinobacterium sp. xm-d-509]NRP99525.1 DNA replication and repair protein RecF [Marinobacterium sp. xm-v-233]